MSAATAVLVGAPAVGARDTENENGVAQVALPPFESATLTVTEKFPVDVGAHERTQRDGEEHPVGVPDHVTTSPPLPVVPVAMRMRDCPMSREVTDPERPVNVGGGATTRVTVPEVTVIPFPSVTETVTVYVPAVPVGGVQETLSVLVPVHPPGKPIQV